MLPLPSASAGSSEHDELGGTPSVGCIAAVDSFAESTCDFIGGASGQCDIPQTDLSAKDTWQEFQAEHTDGEEDKSHQTVRGILLSHPETLADLTHLVDLLPDPRERAAMSKRRWEKLLCRSRALLDMFEEKSKDSPDKVIAALELLATLIAVKLWVPDSKERQVSRVAIRGYTDNQTNEALVKKAMTTQISVNASPT